MLVFDHVTYAYSGAGTLAVKDVSFRVRPGEAVLCTGPSGCGKSTLIRLANGLCPHFFRGDLRGRITVNGRDTAASSLHELAREAGTLFQDPENQFFALTVEDELAFAHEWRDSPPEETLRAVERVAHDFGLEKFLDASILDLSEGQKQKVALASIISLGPKAVILDEPSANLDPEATAALAEAIGELKKSGMAVFVVDHRLYWLENVVDRVMVMAEGRVVGEGGFDLFRDDAFRRERGLRAHRVSDPRESLPGAGSAPPVLHASGIWFAHGDRAPLFENSSFTLPAGVTGILGGNGAGKTTLARLLTGLHSMQSGALLLRGEAVSPEELLSRASIVLQNTDHQLHMNTVRAELAISAMPDRANAAHGTERRVDELLDLFNLRHLETRHPQSLSGGEKQRLVIACGVAKNPEILILDEPTSGLDGRNMRLVADSIRAAAERGAMVLLISHDLELLEMTCDAALRLPL